MLEYLSISKRQPEFPDYLDFQKLREIGIKHLQTLSGKLWTDYNLHDPGVTILEVLCYAVTDLGYRNNLDIQDLLALQPHSQENNFFTADEILSCNPVTEIDIRKRLIDIPGVRNAWLKKVTNYEPAIYINYAQSCLQSTPPNGQSPETAPRLHPRGLYIVYIDLDVGYRRNACGQLYLSWSDTLEEVKKVLCQYRNLCEDIQDVVVLGDEEIAICCDIELKNDADAEDVLVDIYTRLEAFISPNLQFYTLQELLDKGKSIDEIFAGRPTVINEEYYKSHGFIDTDELANLTQPTIIYTSDIYQEILKVPGVAAVKHLSITNYINGLPQSQHPWYLHLTEGYSPVLAMEQSNITLFKGVLPIAADVNEVKRRYYEQQTAYIKNLRENYELNLPVPQGSYYNLADHYSIQHDFPLNYGISEDGLPETVKASRKAQARQLKGYLVFFDQLLANYLSQLAHVRDLFSWEMDGNHQGIRDKNQSSLTHQTYFIQALDFPDRPAILDDNYLQSLEEELDTAAYRDRRHRFLDHLLGRFAESFSDYVLLNYQMTEKHSDQEQHEAEIIQDKANFLKDYPALSRDRFYRDLLGILDSAAIFPTQTPDGFSFKVLSKPGDSKTEIAIHPHNYATATERDAAINRLFLFVRTARLPAQTKDFSDTYLVHIEDENGQKLLQSKIEHIDESAAWKTANQLLEMMQKPGNFRLIESENGLYGWEITNKNTPAILANQYYTSKVERDEAITAIQNSMNDEGFHLLEHILLLPQTNVSVSISEESPTDTHKFLPIFINEDDRTNPEAEPWRLTQQDPYSFWISIDVPNRIPLQSNNSFRLREFDENSEYQIQAVTVPATGVNVEFTYTAPGDDPVVSPPINVPYLLPHGWQLIVGIHRIQAQLVRVINGERFLGVATTTIIRITDDETNPNTPKPSTPKSVTLLNRLRVLFE